MIRKVIKEDIPECAKVIRESFMTVANEFHLTNRNAPRFTAFSASEERISWHMHAERRPMYAYCRSGSIVGYYSLLIRGNSECELNNLCVLPEYRHQGIGEKLLHHAFETARGLNCTILNIGILEENKVLRTWYESFGFVHTGTQKFDFFPFICGYMKKDL